MQDTKKRLKNQALDSLKIDLKQRKEIAERLELCPSIRYDSKGERLVIPYQNLKGKPYQLPNGSKFIRYRNYSSTAKHKYKSPTRKIVGDYDTPLYYPLELQKQFQDKNIQGNTIVLTEGEFKAITAVKNGINTVSFAGTSMYKSASAHSNELRILIDSIQSHKVNVVILFDADAINPYTKKGYTNQRLKNFYNSAKGFFELVNSIHTQKDKSIYLGYIDHQENKAKGLDDLLLSVDGAERKEIAAQLNKPKSCKKYFKLVKVTNRTVKEKIKTLFPAYSLKDFKERYKEELRGKSFEFEHYRKSNNQKYLINYHLDQDDILSATDDFYKNFESYFEHSLEYKHYATERLSSIYQKIEEKFKVLLKAPTGAGKTTLTKELETYYNRIILLEPTRAIAKQQTGYTLVIGGVTIDENMSVDSIVSTFSKMLHNGQITQNDFDNSLLVIDEAHEMYRSFGYRSDECAMLEQLTKMFKYVLATTATPVVPFFKELGFYCSELVKKDQVLKNANISIINTACKKTKGGSVDYKKIIHNCVLNSRSKGRKAYIYNVSKDNYIIKDYHNSDRTNTMLITADTSREEYQNTFNTMLKKERAFVGDYDVLLTNSILETGATFKDQNVDVYILFANNAASIVQACARFRDLETIDYHFYIKKQNWQNSKYNYPKNDLKSQELSTSKDKYKPSFNADIQTGIEAKIKTHNEDFSYSKTFFHFEQDRTQGQPHTKLLGNLKKYFKLIGCKEVDPPRAVNIKADEIEVLPSEILTANGINKTLVSKLLLQTREDKRVFSAFERFTDGLNALETKNFVKSNERYCLNKVCKDTLKLALFCKDMSIKFKIDEQTVCTGARRIMDYLEANKKKINYALIENCLLLQFLKINSKEYYKRIANKGKRIEWKSILEVIENTLYERKADQRYNVFHLRQHEHFRRREKRNLERILQFMNLWDDLTKEDKARAAEFAKLKKIEASISQKIEAHPQNTHYKTQRAKKQLPVNVSTIELIKAHQEQQDKTLNTDE
jgi:energy-coupling factor transporter ATP-binding protein EcfA2